MWQFSVLSVVLAAVQVVHSSPVAMGQLHDCLVNSKVPIISPDFSNFTQEIKPYNLRAPFTPVLAAVPNTAHDVSQALKCAAKYGIKVAARGGGHSYASFGLGGKNGSLMIDLQKFKNIDLDAKNVATVGAGVRLGDLATALYNKGQRALPHGTCAGVGVSGHALHGGFGLTSRMWGLTLDTIVEISVVLADGTITTASEKQNSDLFWALRGAGSSFGIVTEFRFQTYPASPLASFLTFTYNDAVWSDQFVTTLTDILMDVQDFGLNVAPQELALQLYIDASGFSFSGVYWGDQTKALNAVQPLLSKFSAQGVNPAVSVTEHNWLDALVILNGGGPLPQPIIYDKHDTFYAKSIVTPASDLLQHSTVLNFLKFLKGAVNTAPVTWWALFNLYGGKFSKISAVSADSTAYSHRDALLTGQFYSNPPQAGVPYPSTGFKFMDDMVDSITQSQPKTAFKAYPNYVDPQLTKQEAWNLYYGDNYSRLLSIKNKVDPKRLIWNPQSIGA